MPPADAQDLRIALTRARDWLEKTVCARPAALACSRPTKRMCCTRITSSTLHGWSRRYHCRQPYSRPVLIAVLVRNFRRRQHWVKAILENLAFLLQCPDPPLMEQEREIGAESLGSVLTQTKAARDCAISIGRQPRGALTSLWEYDALKDQCGLPRPFKEGAVPRDEPMKLTWKATLALAIAFAASTLGSCASLVPQPPTTRLDYKGRAVTRTEGGLRVSTAVLSADESAAVYGVPLAKRGIQPVWIEVENREKQAYYLLSPGLDPNFFPASEAAEALAPDSSAEQRASSTSAFVSSRSAIRSCPARRLQGSC